MQTSVPRGWQRVKWFMTNPRLVAITGVMLAVVFVATRIIQIPIPGGYVHFGDTAIYFASFIFGPVVGAIAGAVGPALADATSGFGNYAPGTFVIHGLEGLVAGLIAWRGGVARMLVAVIVGGIIIVGGYFLYDYLVLRVGIGTAGTDAGANALQAASALVSIPLVMAVRLAYPPITRWAYRPTWHEETD